MSAQRVLCHLLLPSCLITESQKSSWKMLGKNLQNSCHLRPNWTCPGECSGHGFVLCSKTEGDPLLLNTRAGCYLWFLSWEFHFTSTKICHVFSHRFQKNMGFLKKAFIKSTKSAKEGKLISHLLLCCASKPVLCSPAIGSKSILTR